MQDDRITIRNIDPDVWSKFNQYIIETHGTLWGMVGEVLTDAIEQYMARPQQHHQSTISAKSQLEKSDQRADVQENVERLRIYFRASVLVKGNDHTNLRDLVRDVHKCLTDSRPNLDLRTAKTYALRLIRLGHVKSESQYPMSLFYDRDWLKITDEPKEKESE